MPSLACPALAFSSPSSPFWNAVAAHGTAANANDPHCASATKPWAPLQIVAQRAGARGDRNWGPERKSNSSGTASRESYGRDSFSRESDGAENGRESFPRGRGRGRGRGPGRGRGAGGSSWGRGAPRSGYGNTRGRGGRGRGRGRGGRYDELRRLADKKMHDGAFEMVDEETGEMVIVWGVEDEDERPNPSADDLKWKPTTLAMSGDVSEEGWYKAMEASMAKSSGAFSVRGVRQGGVYSDEDEADDDEDEVDDTDYDDDDEDEEDEFVDNDGPTAGLPEEPRVVKTLRPARLRVFGRDFKQRTEAVIEEVQSGRTVVSSRDRAVALKSQPEPSLNGVGVGDTSAVDDGDVEQSWPPAGHFLNGSSEKESPPSARERNAATKPSSGVQSLSDEEEMEQQWPPVGTILSGDAGASSEEHTSEEHTSEEPAAASSRRESQEPAWKAVERVVREQDWQQGGMNPGIIDLDEDEDEHEHGARRRMADRKPRDESLPVRSNLLDELRLQTHKKLGSKPEAEDVKSPGARAESASAQGRGSAEGSNNVTVVKPRGFRDLKARTNYDPSLAAEFFSTKSFKDVGASEEVIAALATLQLRRPSAIQAMAFKPVLDGQSCIVADQTGSGKTLAYLAPLVQVLRAEEGKSLTTQLNKRPRILVLVPTSELAVQVLNVCRAFSRGGTPFRSIVLTGGFKWKTQVESLAQGADIVVATPGRFLQHLEKGSLKLDILKTVVLDEVDILYDDEEFTEVLQTLEAAAPQRVQYVHVTATLPVDIHDSLLTRYPDAIPLMGPTLHRTAVGLQEVLVDCSGEEGEEKTPEKAFLSKKAVLLQLVEQRPVSKTIIFCNKIETCRDVENALYRHDRNGSKLTVLPYHAALSQEVRLESMQKFLESQPSTNLFLVCTDRASRGLDSFDVEHVVLFDFPRDPSEYVRRVGRTARGAGGTGKVFVFALGKQVAMARRIMDRNEKGRPIHDVPASAYET